MNESTHRIIGIVEYCGVFALVLVMLPILALAFFVARGVLVVAAIMALAGGTLLYCAHPGFRGWFHHLGDEER